MTNNDLKTVYAEAASQARPVVLSPRDLPTEAELLSVHAQLGLACGAAVLGPGRRPLYRWGPEAYAIFEINKEYSP